MADKPPTCMLCKANAMRFFVRRVAGFLVITELIGLSAMLGHPDIDPVERISFGEDAHQGGGRHPRSTRNLGDHQPFAGALRQVGVGADRKGRARLRTSMRSWSRPFSHHRTVSGRLSSVSECWQSSHSSEPSMFCCCRRGRGSWVTDWFFDWMTGFRGSTGSSEDQRNFRILQ